MTRRELQMELIHTLVPEVAPERHERIPITISMPIHLEPLTSNTFGPGVFVRRRFGEASNAVSREHYRHVFEAGEYKTIGNEQR